jgi:hypothetical protein
MALFARERRRVEALLGQPLRPSDGCWEWTGARNRLGYGQVYVQRKQWAGNPARYLFLKLRGPLPRGHVVVQTCGNRLCCRPAHLEAITRAEWIRRGRSPMGEQARRSTCIRGHPLTVGDANVYVRADGSRHCRACGAERARRKRRLKASAT